MSRQDHGGSDGLGLEVVTVTSTDVPLARRQSCGYICLRRRLGKVVTLSTQRRRNWVWWPSQLCSNMFPSTVPSSVTLEPLSLISPPPDSPRLSGSEVLTWLHLSNLQTSFILTRTAKKALQLYTLYTCPLLPPHFSSSCTSFGLSLRLNHLKSLIFDTFCPTKMAFSYGSINIILLAFSWENPRSAFSKCIPSPQEAEITLRIKPKEREKSGQGLHAVLLPDVFWVCPTPTKSKLSFLTSALNLDNDILFLVMY